MPQTCFFWLWLRAGPLLTTNVGEIAKIVAEQGCGTVLADLEPDTIRAALNRYFDPDYWQTQSDRCFQATMLKYNWDLAKKSLITLYQTFETGQKKPN